jgi:hypothetical protein
LNRTTTCSPCLRALSEPTLRGRGLQNVIGLSDIRTEKASDLSDLSDTLEHEVLVIKIIVASRKAIFKVNLYMFRFD